MEQTWRWFGPSDPITLADIRQTGATGIVTALHEIPNGEVWPADAIADRQRQIEAAGLTWSVVESVPVHEDIKCGAPGRDRWIALYQQSLRNLAANGIDVLCYNFMPVLDWTRTDLRYFLRAVVPVAQEVGIRLAIHPDDPPRPLLSLPRVVSTRPDLQWLLDAAPSIANGLTFCTGSLGVRADNDLVAMAGHFAPRIYFAHLRSTVREDTPLSFHEGSHVLGDVDMVGVIAALVAEERRREPEGGPRIPLRPDHGHQLLDDQRRESNPGYSLIGRLKGLAEIRGAETAVRRLLV